MYCRFCGTLLKHTLVDLGLSPLCESYVPEERLDQGETFYPLHVRVCHECLLAQLPEFVPPEEIFTEYAYFSSYSDSWVEHARQYCDMVTERFGLGPHSLVVELASNDGYLLQHFVRRRIPCLGIEPAANVASTAVSKGIETLVRFFNSRLADELAAQGRRADLVTANNVLAQVPDLNDFVAGIRRLLKPTGVATVEVPHLLRLIQDNQFDTIYHEHFSYFSLLSALRIFMAHGLRVFDVEKLPTHGGSLRLFACHEADGRHPTSIAVPAVLDEERCAGLECMDTYQSFGARVEETKRRLLRLLMEIKENGQTVAGYGAPGKANTLLNYCGVRKDLLPFTVDRNPYKQGKYLPGTRIPIYSPNRIFEARPDFVLILPWNLADEIQEQMRDIRRWGGRFVIPIPHPTILK